MAAERPVVHSSLRIGSLNFVLFLKTKDLEMCRRVSSWMRTLRIRGPSVTCSCKNDLK